jgi:hypothetical protein
LMTEVFSITTGLKTEKCEAKQSIAVKISKFLFEVGEKGNEGDIHGD